MCEETLRREVQKLGRGTDRRYPPELREQIRAAADGLRAEGVSWAETSKRLGVSIETLRSWLRSTAIVPVAVDLPAAPTIVVVLPNGIRIEGLDAQSAAAVARALS